MAKSLRSKIKRKFRAIAREAQKPEINNSQTKCLKRAKGYHTLQEIKESTEKNTLYDDKETVEKILTFAKSLQHYDEQKATHIEKGRYFFTHPHAKQDVCSSLKDSKDIPIYTGKKSKSKD